MCPTGPRAALDDTMATAIVDNCTRTVGGFLSGQAVPESLLSVASVDITIYGYGDPPAASSTTSGARGSCTGTRAESGRWTRKKPRTRHSS